MSKFKLSAEIRTDSGKEKAKKLRTEGRFPAIVYGAAGESVSISLNTRDTNLVLNRIHGEKVLVDLEYGSTNDKVFVRNVQRDPVNGKLLHVDFFRVDPNREIDTRIQVVSVGEPDGVKVGGLLEHGVREVAIHALPGNVPPHLEVDVTALQIGQSIHVRDLAPIEGVKFVSAPDAVLFAVVGRSTETAATPADAEAVAAKA